MEERPLSTDKYGLKFWKVGLFKFHFFCLMTVGLHILLYEAGKYFIVLDATSKREKYNFRNLFFLVIVSNHNISIMIVDSY